MSQETKRQHTAAADEAASTQTIARTVAQTATQTTEQTVEQLIAQHLPQPVLDGLHRTISASEQLHTGQLVLCIEASISPEEATRYSTPRDRALALFGELRVWDTEHNNGAMLYLLLDRHAIELIADRALYRSVAPATWSHITTQLAAALRAGQYESGLQAALAHLSDLQVTHFPACGQTPRDNTVADAPVLLR